MKDLAFFSSKNLKVVGATAKENNIIPKIIDVKLELIVQSLNNCFKPQMWRTYV